MKRFPISSNAIKWLETFVGHRFGIKLILSKDEDSMKMTLAGLEGAIVFNNLSPSLTESHSNQPYTVWDSSKEGWHSILNDSLPAPGFTRLPTPLIEKTVNGEHVVRYDILGLIYWMLARVEEIDRSDLDTHKRFTAKVSHGYKHGYLDRPIVDEWLHVLGQVIERQWPDIRLKNHKFKTIVSCDVDHPFEYSGNLKKILRRFAGDILKRKSLPKAVLNIFGEICVHLGYLKIDPNYKGILYIMEECEKNNLQAEFYFITHQTDMMFDLGGGLNVKVRDLMELISVRGHKVGLHPGYNTYLNSRAYNESVNSFFKMIKETKIDQKEFGGRQHYLRWKTPETSRLWSGCDLNYDSTLGYADRAGFRTGTSIEFTMFDAVDQKELNVSQRPLIVMDCSIFDPRYENKELGEGLEYIRSIKEKCMKVRGNFILLWHNSNLKHDSIRKLFVNIIRESSD